MKHSTRVTYSEYIARGKQTTMTQHSCITDVTDRTQEAGYVELDATKKVPLEMRKVRFACSRLLPGMERIESKQTDCMEAIRKSRNNVKYYGERQHEKQCFGIKLFLVLNLSTSYHKNDQALQIF